MAPNRATRHAGKRPIHALLSEPKASASFLKKRSKKLLLNWAGGRETGTVTEQKFFGSFFQKRTASLRALHILQCTNLGGMEQTTARNIKFLHEDCAIAFRIISPRPAGAGAFLFQPFDQAAEFHPYRGKYNWRNHAAFAAGVARLAAEADIIFVTGTCVSSLRAANATGKPVILFHHYHHGNDQLSRLKWRGFYEVLCRRLAAIVFVSPFIRDEAISIAPWLRGRDIVVRQTIPILFTSPEDRARRRAQARERLGLPPDAWIIGNAGWLIPRKRFDVFLNAAAQIKQRIPNAHFVICGDGPAAPALRRQAASLGIAPAVDFLGWVKDLTDHFWAWDQMLFNTDSDAFPRTVLEAAAQGVTIIASSRYGGLNEVFNSGQGAFCFPDHDIAAMAHASLRLFQDAGLRDRLTAEALQILQRDFSTSQNQAALRAVLQTALGKEDTP